MNDVSRNPEHGLSVEKLSAEELFPLVYNELRKLAAQKLSNEKPGQTLQATALVHEAFLRLTNENRAEPWSGRRQFFAAAAEAMRRILVESARRKKSLKRGGAATRLDIHPDVIDIRRPAEEILALHEALDEFAEKHPTKAELVKLRYFVGMTVKEAATILGISHSSVDRKWAYARAWLHDHLKQSPDSEN